MGDSTDAMAAPRTDQQTRTAQKKPASVCDLPETSLIDIASFITSSNLRQLLGIQPFIPAVIEAAAVSMIQRGYDLPPSFADPSKEALDNLHAAEVMRGTGSGTMSVGQAHLLLLTSGEELQGGGNNYDGQLALRDRNQRSKLRPCFEGLTGDNRPRNIVCVGAGEAHSALVTARGEVWTFGQSVDGQLGYSLPLRNAPPRRVPLFGPRGNHAVQVCCSRFFTVVVTARGEVFFFGRWRRPSTADSSGPIKVDLMPAPEPRPSHAQTGDRSSAFNRSASTVVTRPPLFPFLSRRSPRASSSAELSPPSPSPPVRLGPATEVAAADDHCLILTKCGRVFVFGPASTDPWVAEELPRLTAFSRSRGGVMAIANHSDRCVFATRDGAAFVMRYTFGATYARRSGAAAGPTGKETGSSAEASSADAPWIDEGEIREVTFCRGDHEDEVQGVEKVHIVRVACGPAHTLFLSAKGEVYGAGNSHYGQLALGANIKGFATSDHSAATLIYGLPSTDFELGRGRRGGHLRQRVVEIATGADLTLMRDEEGTVYWCGRGPSSVVEFFWTETPRRLET